MHHLKADTLHSQTIHLYQPAPVKSCSLVKIKIPYPATIPLRFSHPDSSKTQNPAPTLKWNSRFPLLFSAPIPNIPTKISQIPHPAKPSVDPLGLSESTTLIRHKIIWKREEIKFPFSKWWCNDLTCQFDESIRKLLLTAKTKTASKAWKHCWIQYTWLKKRCLVKS